MSPRRNRSLLTERELQVAHLVVHGQTNASIGSELDIALDTVKRHVPNIMDKLDANNRADIARIMTEAKMAANPKRSA